MLFYNFMSQIIFIHNPMLLMSYLYVFIKLIYEICLNMHVYKNMRYL